MPRTRASLSRPRSPSSAGMSRGRIVCHRIGPEHRRQDRCRFGPKHGPLDLAYAAAPVPGCGKAPYVAKTFPVSVDKKGRI